LPGLNIHGLVDGYSETVVALIAVVRLNNETVVFQFSCGFFNVFSTIRTVSH
jgi:hypothetical protein